LEGIPTGRKTLFYSREKAKRRKVYKDDDDDDDGGADDMMMLSIEHEEAVDVDYAAFFGQLA